MTDGGPQNQQLPEQAAEDQRWMRYALALAEHAAAQGEVPVAAVIVRDGELIGEGWNQPISAADPTAHAEVVALRQACAKLGNYRLNDATLYVTLEPCTMCCGALVHARIGRVVIGCLEPKSGAVRSQAALLDAPYMNHRVAYSTGVLESQCSAALTAFFARRRAEKKRARRAE